MYFYERPITGNTASLYSFFLIFTIICAENVSFYFSLHENRGINSAFITSRYTDDVMSCARACAIEFNCNTANYRTTEKKCDLSKERLDNITNGAAMVILKGCYLILKVRSSLYLLNQFQKQNVWSVSL